MKYLLCIGSVWFFSYSVISKADDSLPFYETCNWKNAAFTNQLVKDTEQFLYGSTQMKSLCTKCLKDKIFLDQNTRSLSEVMEHTGRIPPICFLAAGLRSVGVYQSKRVKKKSYYYCESSKASRPESLMPFVRCNNKSGKKTNCLNKNKRKRATNKIYPNKPCLSSEYIRATAKAFNDMADCFNFSSLEDKKHLFALFNHQSAFLLNKRGSMPDDSIPEDLSKQNSCYGQVSNEQVMDINVDIRYPTEVWGGKSGHFIYRSAIKKCPHLKNRIPLLKFCRQKKKKGKKTVEQKREQYRACLEKNHSGAMACNVSHNPYSCLFYSLFQIQKDKSRFAIETTRQDLALAAIYREKINQLQTQKTGLSFLEKLTAYLGIDVVGDIEKQKKTQLRIVRLLTRKFKLPVLSNEMLSVHVDTFHKTRGEEKTKRIFNNLSEVHSFFTDPNLFYDEKTLRVKKTKIFKERDFNWAFVHWLRQPGIHLSVDNIPYFMGYVKSRIQTDSRYRDSILSGQSLALSDLSKEFDQYAKENDIYSRNYPQSNGFLRAIDKNLGYLFNKDNQLKRDLKSMHRDRPLTEGQVNNFLQRVRFSCPTGLLKQVEEQKRDSYKKSKSFKNKIYL